MALDPKLFHPSEKSLTTAAMVLSGLAWFALLCAVVVYGPFIALSVLIAHGLFLANVRGNGVRISGTQYPALHEAVQTASRKLGLATPPAAYVLQQGGFLNAFATRFLSRNYIVIFSDLVEHCHNPTQAAFVIGHEVGHLAAGHLAWNVFLLPSMAVPWLGAALRRSQEYTCDRCGHAATGNLEESKRALAVLAAGGKLAQQTDLGAFTAQRADGNGFFMTAFEIGSEYPFLCNRVAALDNLEQPNLHPPVARHPLGVLLGPFFGGSLTASILPLILVIGVLAAIALPNYLRFQQRAADAATLTGTSTADDPQDLDPSASDPVGDAPPADEVEAQPPPSDFFVVRLKSKGTQQSMEAQAQKMGESMSQALGEMGSLDDVSCDAESCELVFIGSDADAMAQALSGKLKAWKLLKKGSTLREYGDGREPREEQY